MKIPMTAREQLLLAHDLGHDLTVDTRIREDFPDAPPKFWVSCTCGYKSTVRRSYVACNGVLAWHLGKAIGAANLDGVAR